MKVMIPSALRSYTQAGTLDAEGGTVAEVLADLERRYPGIRFRMIDERGRFRPHIRFFVGGRQVGTLEQPVSDTDELVILQALSGG